MVDLSHQSLSSLPGFSDLAKRSNLTNSQLLIWLGQQLNPDSPLYNMAMRFDIYGAIDIETFENALGAVVGASDSMRSIIEMVDEIPQQRVLDHQVNPLEILDFSDGGDADTRCSQEIASRTTKLFDLSSINFTTVLIKLGPAHFVWFFNQHHLFTDIKSIELIYKQVSRRYLDLTSALSAETNPDLPQFGSYLESESQRSQNYENTNPPEGLEPVSLYHRKGNHRRTAAHRVEQSLTAPDLDRLKALAAKPGFATLSPELSLFNVVATAFCAYLHRISDSEALAIGAPVHNRT
ncbi:MAG: condensation domain-containing protein, partial [Gammaproteobacteria bacterium]